MLKMRIFNILAMKKIKEKLYNFYYQIAIILKIGNSFRTYPQLLELKITGGQFNPVVTNRGFIGACKLITLLRHPIPMHDIN